MKTSAGLPRRVSLRNLFLISWAIYGAGSLNATALAQSATTAASSADTEIASYESGGDTQATNPNSTATGSYQDTVAFLESAGVLTSGSSNEVTSADYGDSNWSNLTFAPNQWGITSRQQLLDASPEVQTEIENAGLSDTWTQMTNNGATNYIGQTAPGGQVINQSALLACGENLGAGGCNSFLQNGTTGNPATDQQVEQEMEAMSQTDSSAITGQATNQVAEAGGGSTGAGQNGDHTYMYCPPSVSAAMQQVSIANVNQAVIVASRPTMGYSLADGSALSAGATGSSGAQPDDFGVASCLNNLFSFQGMNFLFTTPNLIAIIQHLVGMACSYAENVKTQMLSPLNQNAFQNIVPQGFEPFIGEQGFGGMSSLGGNNDGGISFGVDNGNGETQVLQSNPVTGSSGMISTGNVDVGIAQPNYGGGSLP